MEKPVKILELSGDDFLKGLSTQPTLARNGIFRSAPGFDPFEVEGYLLPSLQATELTAPVTDPIKVITNWNSGGTEYIYAHSNSKLYQYLRNSPYTQTDVSAQIDLSATAYGVTGAIIWKGRYIYAQDTDLRSNTLPVAIGNDVQILSGSNSTELDVRPMCIGSDKNLYIGDYGSVAKCTNATGTSGNALDELIIDYNYTVRAIVNDGVYLIIFADNNQVTSTARKQGNYSCKVYFWDIGSVDKTSQDFSWVIPGASYIIGAEIVNGIIKVFTPEGIYMCNSGTPPRLIWRFSGNSTITKRPMTPYQITNDGETVYWGDGETNGQNVYANTGSTFYTPYITHGSSAKHTALNYSAGVLFAATDSPKFYIHNVGTTRGNATAQTANIVLNNPFSLSFIKIVLKERLSSGQSVAVSLFDSEGTVISDTDTKSHSTIGAKKSLKFERTAVSGSIQHFEDFYLQINPQGGAAIERITVYGVPSSDDSQII